MPNKKPPQEHQFKKGQSGNPKGRPKGIVDMRVLLMQYLAVERAAKGLDGKKRKYTLAELGTLRAIEKMIGGDHRFYKTITEQVSGMPTARHEVEGEIKATVAVDGMDEFLRIADECKRRREGRRRG
jgi:hypothetical protein